VHNPFSPQLLRQLAEADARISQIESNITRQLRVAASERAKQDARLSSDLSQTFRECLARHHQHRQHVLHELETTAGLHPGMMSDQTGVTPNPKSP
jgi:hypothetical protein